MRNNKGQFKKELIPWNKGMKKFRGEYKLSEIHKQRIAEANTGKKRLGIGGVPKGTIPWNKGIKCPQFSNENHPRWKGGISKLSTYATFCVNKRRAIKMKAEGSHTFEEWEALKKKFNYMCLCCKKYEPEITLTQDHIVPLIKKGSDYIENIQPLCRSCNSIKHIKVINFVDIWQKQKVEIL